MKKNIVVLFSYNPSRLHHLKRLSELSDQFRFLLVVDRKKDFPWLREFVPEVYTMDFGTVSEKIAEIVADISGVMRPDGIINLSEDCVYPHSLLCREFTCFGPEVEAAQIARDKFKMRSFLKGLGIPSPECVLVKDPADGQVSGLRFPVVVKPYVGTGSNLVQRFDDHSSLVAAWPGLQSKAIDTYSTDSLFRQESDQYRFPFVVEELIGGETAFPTLLPYPVGEISVESVHCDGVTTVLGIHDKLLPNNGPYYEELMTSTPSRIPQELTRLAAKYVDAIHRGLGKGSYVLHTEFRTIGDGLVCLEFGGRLGGGPIYRSLVLSTATDPLSALIAIALGHKPILPTGEQTPTICHTLWSEHEGYIQSISGLPRVIFDPDYIEHQFYDDIGDLALRAPKARRSLGVIFFSSLKRDFPALERKVLNALETIKVLVDPVSEEPLA